MAITVTFFGINKQSMLKGRLVPLLNGK